MAAIPSLDGWVTDPMGMAVKLFKYAYTSEKDQSVDYRGNVTSIAGLVADYGNEPDNLKAELTSSLSSLFLRHFDDASVRVTDSTIETPGANYDLDIEVLFEKDGKSYSLAAELGVTDNRLVKFLIENINA